MQSSKRVWIGLTLWLATGSVGCSLSIDQILEMQEGSAIDLFMIPTSGPEIPQGTLEFEGGTVMRIDVSTSLFDYLDGTVDGDVDVLDLFFAVPSIKFLGAIPTGTICVILNPDVVSGGTFEYDIVAQEALFDVLVATLAIPTSPVVGPVLDGGAFDFPFELQSSVPLTLLDAVGLVSGTGSLEVTQPIDDVFEVKAFGGQSTFFMHAVGEVTLASTDTFPFTPLMDECLTFLETF